MKPTINVQETQKAETKGGCGGHCGNCECGCDHSTAQTTGFELDNIKLEIFRNRSEMEAQITLLNTGEKVTRVPVKWKSRAGKLDYLSVSKIQSYEQCPACFFHEYISEETAHVDNANYYTKFGSILHEVVEVIVKAYMKHGIVLPTESVFNDTWRKYDLTGFGAFEEAKGLAVNYFNTNPVDQRDDIPEVVEEEWRGELGGCTFGMQIDYAGRKKKNPSIGILRDYKTNRMPFTPAELSSSLQLRIYQIVLRRHFMQDILRWISGYDLFYHGWQQCKEFTDDDLKNAEEYVADTYHQIITDTVWEEKLNPYCGYRECRHTCSKYKEAIRNSAISGVKYVINEDTDWEQIEKEREYCASLEKNAKNRLAELNDIMKYHIEESLKSGKKVIIGDKELQLTASSTPSYRYDDVNRVLLCNNRLDLLNGFTTIRDMRGFDRLVKAQDMDLRLQLTGCMQNSYSTPYITKKRK